MRDLIDEVKALEEEIVLQRKASDKKDQQIVELKLSLESEYIHKHCILIIITYYSLC